MWDLLPYIAITVLVAALGILIFIVSQEIRKKAKDSVQWPATILSIGLVIFVFPMTVAAFGPASNGGPDAVFVLTIASVFAWYAAIRNRKDSIIRRGIQLPLVTFTTYLAVRNLYLWCVFGGPSFFLGL